MWEEAYEHVVSEEKNADRERQFRKDEDNYEDTEAEESIKDKGLSDIFDKIMQQTEWQPHIDALTVRDEEEVYQVEQDRNIDHARDNE